MSSKSSTVLFAVRHGETEWNRIGRQQGHLDSPLTASGLEQAQAMAEGLSGRGIEVIYSSDLGRSLRTAEIIARKLQLPIATDARLRERHLGVLQGLTMADFSTKYPEEARAFSSGDPDYALPGGESARQRFTRNIECVQELAIKHAGGTVLVVAHGGVLNSLFHRAVHLPLDQPRGFSLFNAAINVFTIAGLQWRLDTWGDRSHLGGLAALDDS